MVKAIMGRRDRNLLWARNLLFVGLVCTGGAGLIGGLFPQSIGAHSSKDVLAVAPQADYLPLVEEIDREFHQRWSGANLSPAPRAADLTIARRLALALTGGIPSLQEMRGLDAEPEGRLREDWLTALFKDRRFTDYFAERPAPGYGGPQ